MASYSETLKKKAQQVGTQNADQQLVAAIASGQYSPRSYEEKAAAIAAMQRYAVAQKMQPAAVPGAQGVNWPAGDDLNRPYGILPYAQNVRQIASMMTPKKPELTVEALPVTIEEPARKPKSRADAMKEMAGMVDHAGKVMNSPEVSLGQVQVEPTFALGKITKDKAPAKVAEDTTHE